MNAEAGAFRFAFEAFRNTSEELILSDLQEWIEYELPEYGKLITFKEYEECEGVTDTQTLSGRENSEDSKAEEERIKNRRAHQRSNWKFQIQKGGAQES